MVKILDILIIPKYTQNSTQNTQNIIQKRAMHNYFILLESISIVNVFLVTTIYVGRLQILLLTHQNEICYPLRT